MDLFASAKGELIDEQIWKPERLHTRGAVLDEEKREEAHDRMADRLNKAIRIRHS